MDVQLQRYRAETAHRQGRQPVGSELGFVREIADVRAVRRLSAGVLRTDEMPVRVVPMAHNSSDSFCTLLVRAEALMQGMEQFSLSGVAANRRSYHAPVRVSAQNPLVSV